MIKNDICVNRKVCPGNNAKDITKQINQAFNCNVYTVEGAILILAAHCIYITFEELYTFFPLKTNQLDSNVFTTLVKKGYLEKCSFSKKMGVSRKCFRITQAGHDAANEYAGGTITSKFYKAKNSKSPSETFLEHIYLTGFNVFSFLTLGVPFQWQREYPVSENRSYRGARGNNDLIADAKCSIHPESEDRKRFLYIEEDTGTEGIDVLLGKLKSYQQAIEMNSSSKTAIIFSVYDKNASAPSNSPKSEAGAYSTPKARKVYIYMKENKVDDLCELVGNNEVDQEYLFDLLNATGTAILLGGEFFRSGIRFSLEDMEAFYSDLCLRRNPYQHKAFNILHIQLSFKRMLAMANRLFVNNTRRLPAYGRCMTAGFPVYFMPTTLLADRFQYAFLQDYPAARKKIEKVLSTYYSAIKFVSDVSEPIYDPQLEDYVCFRNIFSYGYVYEHSGIKEKGYISIEFLSFDLGAWLRTYWFEHYLRSDQKPAIKLIVVLDTYDEYQLFLKTIKYRNKGKNYLDRSGIYGVYFKDILEEKKIAVFPID